MAGRVEDVRADFHDASVLHDRRPAGDGLHRIEVVAYEHEAHIPASAQIPHEVQHLGLD
jgi:hypothetical protein